MKQEIEKAARIEREKVIQELHDAYNIHKDPKHYVASSATIGQYAVPLFKKGAEWYAKQSPWISVKDGLPEEGVAVLIMLKDGVARLAVLDTDDNSNVYFWSDNYAYETIRGWNVTHWMPIPPLESNGND